MKSFELYEPASVQEAVAILAKFHGKAKPLAGGSDLVSGVMKDWIQGQAMPLPDVLAIDDHTNYWYALPCSAILRRWAETSTSAPAAGSFGARISSACGREAILAMRRAATTVTTQSWGVRVVTWSTLPIQPRRW